MTDLSNRLHELPCPHCGKDTFFPVEPIFDLRFTAALVGISVPTLRTWLSRGPGKTWPARYRWHPPALRVRVLFASEVREIQRHFIRMTRRVEPKPTQEGCES